MRSNPFVGHIPNTGLIMPPRALAMLHPAQLADLVELASYMQGEEIMSAVRTDPELAADVFEELEPGDQFQFVESRSSASSSRSDERRY